jgi:hypothetical protein
MLVVAVYAPCDKMRIERVHQNLKKKTSVQKMFTVYKIWRHDSAKS